MKRRNPNFGCPKIAEQIFKTLAIPLYKDVVRRILVAYYRPKWGDGLCGASIFSGVSPFESKPIGSSSSGTKCMRRIIGFGVHPAPAMGRALCRLIHQATSRQGLPQWLSSDYDPVFRFHQWQANLRILGIQEVKTTPIVPVSHPSSND